MTTGNAVPDYNNHTQLNNSALTLFDEHRRFICGIKNMDRKGGIKRGALVNTSLRLVLDFSPEE